MPTLDLRCFFVILIGVFVSSCRDRRTVGESSLGNATDWPVSVENSGSAKVDAVVVKLVSKRPAPYPTGYNIDFGGVYITAEAEGAIRELKNMGPQIFPALITHLRDTRYSFSYEPNAWVNSTVGDAVSEVLSDGKGCAYEYLARETPSGTSRCPSFEKYLDAREPKKWADWAKDKARWQIRVDFLQWCLAQEIEQGFVDETQRIEIVTKYERALKEASQPTQPRDK